MSKKIQKNVIFIATLILFFNLTLSNVFATENHDNGSNIIEYSVDEAESVAIMHIKSIMTTEDNGMWNQDICISERKALFDTNETISGYYFKIENIFGEPAGYVITGANSKQFPIIEYSNNGNGFFEESVTTITSNCDVSSDSLTKFYYTDDLTYVCKFFDNNTEHFFDISSSNFSEIPSIDSYAKNYDIDYSNDWYTYLRLSESTNGSNPPDEENTYITQPLDYESGYNLTRYYTLPSYERKYKTTSNFSGSDNCAPTTAVNLCYYWYSRDPSTYGALKQDIIWSNVHDDFYNLMGTRAIYGTSDTAIAGAYETYFNYVGLSCQATLHYSTDYGQKIVDELRNSRPVHLILHNHRTYGNHSVLALGFYQFQYDDGNSTYIRIADGWSTDPNRYVWGGCAGYWNYVTVIPQ